jgi:MFS family permease
MRTTIVASWALFLGIAMIMLGNGLQGSLLGLRATVEGFATATTGFVMSGYYVGFLLGSSLTPKLVKRVGHIRVFTALASMASAAVLLHAVFITPAAWMAMRIVTGFSYAGLYVVAESWLNDRATNETRGQLLSVYMVIMLGGMGSGQLLLNVADPAGFQLFILVSVLVSAALVPIALTAFAAPNFSAPSHVGVKRLYGISPLGVFGAFGTGIAHGAAFGMGAVYARNVGLSVGEISYFMAAPFLGGVFPFLGGVLLQWPIGHLSDRVDRRRIIAIVTFVAAIVAFAAIPVSGQSTLALLVLMCLFGGMSLPLYSLCLAYTNDHLEPSQMVAASATLVFVTGAGAIFGPTLAAVLMSVIGSNGFFWWLGSVHAVIGAFAIYRMTKSDATPVEEQTHCVPVPPRASPVSAYLTHSMVRDEMDRDLARFGRSRR